MTAIVATLGFMLVFSLIVNGILLFHWKQAKICISQLCSLRQKFFALNDREKEIQEQRIRELREDFEGHRRVVAKILVLAAEKLEGARFFEDALALYKDACSIDMRNQEASGHVARLEAAEKPTLLS